MFLFRWPDRLRFPAFLVGNTAPKAWKRVKVAIRFRLRSPLPLLSVPAGRAQLMPKRDGGEEKKNNPNLPGKLEIYVGLYPKIN